MKRILPLTFTLLVIGIVAFAVIAFTPAIGANPFKLKYQDEDWITVTGDVNSITPDAFTLDFGDGLITVEMDDWDFYSDTSRLVTGEKVTVYGVIDNGFYEAKTIEADMVYAHDRSTYFYANDADEEDDYPYYYSYYHTYPVAVPDGTWLSVSGRVTDINGRELTLNTGENKLIVDTKELNYNPLDDKGYQQIDKGDRIYVTGLVDINIFDANELDALTITSLTQDRTKRVGRGS